MCGWGPYAREASVWEACCRYCDVINMFLIWARPLSCSRSMRASLRCCFRPYAFCVCARGSRHRRWRVSRHLRPLRVRSSTSIAREILQVTQQRQGTKSYERISVVAMHVG